MKKGNSSEDYLKNILILQAKNGHVRAVDVAAGLGVTRPSVSAAMKRLRENGAIYIDEDGYICLTSKGKQLAEKVNSKHTLIRNFLISIGVNEKVATEEACLIEHDIGEETFRRLEEEYGKKPCPRQGLKNDAG